MSETSGRIVLRAGAATDTGRSRANNQDSFLLLPDRGLWIVADGMGGAQGGEVASKLAVDTLAEEYLDPGTEALTEAFAAANSKIYEAAESSELRGMGTTTVALALVPADPVEGDDAGEAVDHLDHLVIVNVGDSRAYLYRDGGLTQLTEDHSVVAEMVRDGRITAEQAEAHPQRNIITRVLGVYPQVRVDIWPVDPVRGDRFLLCSDGLFNEVADDQMAAVLRRLQDPDECAKELVRLANDAGGRDNITVVVVDVLDDGGVAARASRAVVAGASAPDLAGFSSALDDDDLEQAFASTDKPSRAERRAERRAARGSRTRITWRVLLFLLLVVGVIGGAFATIQWYGTSTYYVGFDGDEVAIFQGRPGGLLWIDPELEDGTGILREEVPARYLAALEDGHQQSSLAQARRYVSNIERDIAETAERTTTTTTAPTTATTRATTTTAAN